MGTVILTFLFAFHAVNVVNGLSRRTMAGALQASNQAQAATNDRTITRIVKMLQELVDQTKQDAEQDRTLFAKHKCFCDTNKEENRNTIEEEERRIETYENQIQSLQSSSGLLSTELAQLKADMAQNEQDRSEANSLRKTENEAFVATESDLKEALEQMKKAIQVLSNVGADQSQASKGHEQYMAGHSGHGALVSMRTTVTKALNAALTLASDDKKSAITALLQAFPDTYSSQSGSVVGILSDMADTFKANLAEATRVEELAVSTHTKFISTKEKAYQTMEESETTKKAELSTNDAKLSSTRIAKDASTQALNIATDDLKELNDICAQKKNEYETRQGLRSEEQVALSKAISILNSDAAFETFGKVDATSSGFFFLQIGRGIDKTAEAAKASLESLMQEKGVPGGQNKMIKRVIALLSTGNPFKVVLNEIDKLTLALDAEEAADKNQLDWCNKERTHNRQERDTKTANSVRLDGDITGMNVRITAPDTGFLDQISDYEKNLETNDAEQKQLTKDRTEDHAAYLKSVEHLDEAVVLLNRAITVLEQYYERLEAGLMSTAVRVQRAQSPADDAPETWNGKYAGAAGGTDESGSAAVVALKGILDKTNEERKNAHKTESEAQIAFEDAAKLLTDEEADLVKNLAEMKETLAQERETLARTKAEKKALDAEIAAHKAYLLSIKPGCDFISKNYDTRSENRNAEKAALGTAKDTLQNSPVYRNAVEEADHNSFKAECRETCIEKKEHVNCKACEAGVSVPGFCAGHSGTDGCAA